MKSKTKQEKKGINLSFIILLLICIIFLAPFFFMLVTSFKPGQEMLSEGLSFKMNFDEMTLNNYKIIFFEDNRYLSWYKNSLIITVLQTVLSLFFSSLVGYGLAVYNFKGKNILFFLVLLVMMVPPSNIITSLIQIDD